MCYSSVAYGIRLMSSHDNINSNIQKVTIYNPARSVRTQFLDINHREV